MNIRRVSMAIAVAAALAAGAAAAQQQSTIAQLSDLKGTVLVSQGDAMAAAGANVRVPVNTRVIAGAGSTVTIVYDTGCRVRLTENQRFTVATGDCAALLASVQPAGTAPGAIGGATAAAGGTITGTFIGAVVIAGVAYQVFRDNSVSPN